MDNLEEMDKFLETHNLLRLNQVEMDNLSRPITSYEIKLVIKKLPVNKSPILESFTGEFYPAYKEDWIAILLKLFPKKLKRRETPKFTIQGHSTLMLKPDRDATKKRKL